jgi:hypothetical protein
MHPNYQDKTVKTSLNRLISSELPCLTANTKILAGGIHGELEEVHDSVHKIDSKLAEAAPKENRRNIKHCYKVKR